MTEPGGDDRTVTCFPNIPQTHPVVPFPPSRTRHFLDIPPNSSLPRCTTTAPSARELLEVVASSTRCQMRKPSIGVPSPSRQKQHLDQILRAFFDASTSHGFITMLAPIRDYLNSQDLKSSPLLCATKDRYFSRLSADVDPDAPGFRQKQGGLCQRT